MFLAIVSPVIQVRTLPYDHAYQVLKGSNSSLFVVQDRGSNGIASHLLHLDTSGTILSTTTLLHAPQNVYVDLFYQPVWTSVTSGFTSNQAGVEARYYGDVTGSYQVLTRGKFALLFGKGDAIVLDHGKLDFMIPELNPVRPFGLLSSSPTVIAIYPKADNLFLARFRRGKPVKPLRLSCDTARTLQLEPFSCSIEELSDGNFISILSVATRKKDDSPRPNPFPKSAPWLCFIDRRTGNVQPMYPLSRRFSPSDDYVDLPAQNQIAVVGQRIYWIDGRRIKFATASRPKALQKVSVHTVHEKQYLSVTAGTTSR